MIEQSISHYHIVKKLGAGGMGEVYLAEDTQLGRRVALKFLPADVASDEGPMRRFIQEARAASALNHPNILTVYEFGEAESIYFIATEFIDGVTLRKRMQREPMKVSLALDVAVQTTEALAAAADQRWPNAAQEHEAGNDHGGRTAWSVTPAGC
jgi:serine/threonine protein kinase